MLEVCKAVYSARVTLLEVAECLSERSEAYERSEEG